MSLNWQILQCVSSSIRVFKSYQFWIEFFHGVRLWKNIFTNHWIVIQNCEMSKVLNSKFFKVSNLELANFRSWDIQLQSGSTTSTFGDIHFHTPLKITAFFIFLNSEKNNRPSSSSLCTNLQRDFIFWFHYGVWLFSVWIRYMQKPAATEKNFDIDSRNVFVSRMSD